MSFSRPEALKGSAVHRQNMFRLPKKKPWQNSHDRFLPEQKTYGQQNSNVSGWNMNHLPLSFLQEAYNQHAEEPHHLQDLSTAPETDLYI